MKDFVYKYRWGVLLELSSVFFPNTSVLSHQPEKSQNSDKISLSHLTIWQKHYALNLIDVHISIQSYKKRVSGDFPLGKF